MAPLTLGVNLRTIYLKSGQNIPSPITNTFASLDIERFSQSGSLGDSPIKSFNENQLQINGGNFYVKFFRPHSLLSGSGRGGEGVLVVNEINQASPGRGVSNLHPGGSRQYAGAHTREMAALLYSWKSVCVVTEHYKNSRSR